MLPSLLSVLFLGDAILEVNGERVKYAPVEKVVEAISSADSSEMSVRPIIIPLVLVSVYTTNDSCTSYNTCDYPVADSSEMSVRLVYHCSLS